MDRVQGHIGETMAYAKWTRMLLGRQKNAVPVFDALNGYLFMLRKAGYVTFDNWGGLRVAGDSTVVADLDHPPAPPEDPPWRVAPVRLPSVPKGQPLACRRRSTNSGFELLISTLSEPTTTSKLMAEAGVRPSPDSRRQVMNLLLGLKRAKRLHVERCNDIRSAPPWSVSGRRSGGACDAGLRQPP